MVHRRAIEAGHADAMFNLGHLMMESGRTEEAEQWYQRVVGPEDPTAMSRSGDPFAEERQIRRRPNSGTGAPSEVGDTEAMNNLGNLLAENGQTEASRAVA